MKKMLLCIIVLLCSMVMLIGCVGSTSGENLVSKAPENLATYKLKISVEFASNLLLSKYDVKLLINGDEKATLKHGTDGEFEYSLKEGDYTITFVNTSSSSVKGETRVSLHNDTLFSCKITCHYDNVEIEDANTTNIGNLASDDVLMDSTMAEFETKNYQEIVNKLLELGFSNVTAEPIYDIVWGITPKESVESVSIAGSTTYKKGDVFKSTAEVIVKYHMSVSDEPASTTNPSPTEEPGSTPMATPTMEPIPTSVTLTPTPTSEPATPTPTPTPKGLYYTTNDKKAAKEGKTGIYAYRNRGTEYYVYYVINFDEGFVYRFTEGNGDATCDKLKIEGESLNSRLKITYHYGSESWSEYIHFKYKNIPDILVMVDYANQSWEFDADYLDKALEYLSKKTIIEHK